MIDVTRVREKLAYMRSSTAELRQIAAQSSVTSRDLWAARFLLHTGIEAMIDVANHLIARLGLRAPQGYAEAFDRVTEAGLLQPEHASQWRALVRLRNRLVHQYDTVSDTELLQAIALYAPSFDQFIAAIESYLERAERGHGAGAGRNSRT